MAQEFHANKAQYVMLAMTDMALVFELISSTSAESSRLIFRDPESFVPKFTNPEWLDSVLVNIPLAKRQEVTRAWCNRANFLYEPVDDGVSMLQVLVAGLVAPLDLVEDFWLDGKAIALAVSEVNAAKQSDKNRASSATHPASPSAYTKGDERAENYDPFAPGLPSSSAQTQSGQCPELHFIISDRTAGLQLERVQTETTHYLPVAHLAEFSWSTHPKFGKKQRLSTGSSKGTTNTDDSGWPQEMEGTMDELEERWESEDEGNEQKGLGSGVGATLRLKQPGDGFAKSLPPVIPPSPAPAPPRPPLEPSFPPLSLTLHTHTSGTTSKLNLANFAPPPLTVKLETYLGSGRLYDVYRASLPSSSSYSHRLSSSSVVVKFNNPATFDLNDGQYTSSQAEEAMAREVKVLCGPLRVLQGFFVPKLLGAWRGEWTVKPTKETTAIVRFGVMVMEDCGEPWAKRWVYFLASCAPSRPNRFLCLWLLPTLKDRESSTHSCLFRDHPWLLFRFSRRLLPISAGVRVLMAVLDGCRIGDDLYLDDEAQEDEEDNLLKHLANAEK